MRMLLCLIFVAAALAQRGNTTSAPPTSAPPTSRPPTSGNSTSGNSTSGNSTSHNITSDMSQFWKLLNANDTIILLLDHQTALFQTVHDISLFELYANVKALIQVANLARVPIIYTASEPDGPNGPLISQVASLPTNATFIRRHGEISAWENQDFVNAVRRSNKKTLVMAGVWTSVCVVFPALQAKADGFTVYTVVDASGDISPMASHATMLRLNQAGVITVSTNVIVGEIQRTWNRPDAAAYASIYAGFSPNYGAAVESFNAAQKSSNSNSTSTSNSTQSGGS